LNDEECQILAASMQRSLDDLHSQGDHGPWSVEFGPSAAEDPAAFVTLKSEWETRRAELEAYRDTSPNSWQTDVYWLFSIASEYADIIRDMRGGQIPTVYLQCDGGHGYETFERLDTLTWEEIGTLESVLATQLHEFGLLVQVISDWHAENEPDAFINARLSWDEFKQSLELDDAEEADEARLTARGVALRCIDEVLSLRSKPVIFEQAGDNGEENHAPLLEVQANLNPRQVEHREADESLRSSYRDPDNYWRNVWLYQQRRDGKTNGVILTELATRAADFAPLESENALRTAIETIAAYHHWPLLKGKSGRPKAAQNS
jgi:hypothetical protein